MTFSEKKNTIRVLCADLSAADDRVYGRLYEMASPERKNRADRFRRREDALRCVAADALLRRVLGADAQRIKKTPAGKPYLPGRPDFYFNLSHGGPWVVIAFGGCEVGVDVEPLRTDRNIDGIARRYFAQAEQQYVFDDEALRQQRFFEVWTGKESYLKYQGTGLTRDLTSFSVLDPEPPVRLHLTFLPDGSPLSLCTTAENYALEFINAQDL